MVKAIKTSKTTTTAPLNRRQVSFAAKKPDAKAASKSLFSNGPSKLFTHRRQFFELLIKGIATTAVETPELMTAIMENAQEFLFVRFRLCVGKMWPDNITTCGDAHGQVIAFAHKFVET